MEKEDLKIGDIVEVVDCGRYKDAIFIKHGNDDAVIIVEEEDEEKYKEGSYFSTIWYSHYRIKKQPEYVPYSFEDAEELRGIWVKNSDGFQFFIIAIFDSSVALNRVEISFSQLLAEYSKLDGTPCGKIKE